MAITLTYTLVDRGTVDGNSAGHFGKSKVVLAGGGRKQLRVTLGLSGTYETGGFAVSGASLGLPNSLESLLFIESSATDTRTYKFDKSTSKVLILAEGTDGILAQVANGSTPTANELIVEATGW